MTDYYHLIQNFLIKDIIKIKYGVILFLILLIVVRYREYKKKQEVIKKLKKRRFFNKQFNKTKFYHEVIVNYFSVSFTITITFSLTKYVTLTWNLLAEDFFFGLPKV